MNNYKLKKVLITGAAGFIGYHISKYLLSIKSFNLIGIDNLSDNLYASSFKKTRANLLKKNKSFKFIKLDILEINKLEKVFKSFNPDIVIHLAASPGVRQSLKKPNYYFNNNVNTFINIINLEKEFNCKFLYASSSSVYNSEFNKFPFTEDDKILKPKSIYGLTKLNNEIIAQIYNDNYNFRSIGLRFFTVYGEYGRPDMAVQLFLDSIYNKRYINLFNSGSYFRSFTYIDDVVMTIYKLLKLPLHIFRQVNIINIGSTKTYKLTQLISILEKSTNLKARIKLKGKIKNEPFKTHANMKKGLKLLGKLNNTDLETGILKTVSWYKKNFL